MNTEIKATTVLDPATAAAVERAARENGWSISKAIRELLKKQVATETPALVRDQTATR